MVRPGEAQAIVAGTHGDPFAVLGVHREDEAIVARCYIPGAQDVAAFGLDGTPLGTLMPTGEGGLFAGPLKLVAPKPVRYHARNPDGDWWVDDPYAYGPVLGPLDDHYIGEGTHLRLFDKLGAHLLHHEGSEGMHFAVWAPNARRVSVVGPFNQWDGRRHVMRLRRDTGIWEIFIPGVGTGEAYKFEILANNGTPLPLKADPFAFHAELRPYTASLTTAPLAHEWGDHEHRGFWAKADARRQPISIYEVHAGSWRRGWQGEFLTWDELADQLIPYVVDLGFTHIELMPITEHPYDPSWGYQTTGMFAPTSRFGDGEGFARFVDGCHRAGIGVILDWVPAHFPVDAFGLEHFDGTALYEHADPRQGFHPDWNTAIYNFGRSEVSAFLVNSALYWTETFHLDGLRVDAVASMLYLDYSRKSGEWVPNAQGGRENVDAVAFLQRMNAAVYGANPGVMTIAEESTSWPGVSKPVHEGGLGFGFKWNMGFMHDTLAYLARDPVHRPWHHDELLFGLVYAFDENFVLPLSHDEVVHGKGTLLTKMAGTYWQKFANLRAYYGFMWGYPGKKLLFMGQEFAQAAEWSEARGLDWHLLDQPAHDGVRGLVRDLNRVYRKHPALHARDCEGEGFAWIVADDRDNAVFAWVRQAPSEAPVVVVTNFTPQVLTGYRITLPRAGTWCEILNTDAHVYGGSGVGNFGGIVAAEDGGAVITIPPLATIMFEHNT
ncbi:1,4-alpha-glucan branching protein GlgB [Sphingomonas sp. BAUL-RG-20F-R05-02]|uniref:1,4-alpha-glucan branching protein GlgB n=1 Tax=Sphingomonas sp. BAUL-RG-20F-R05-02 TaxID=2914830 RepID=UPI001F5626C7|nr:1,4-alpha-glucan branching protein GlgB [Sphingomonas sp. BAUL-RG-20F-R05-02]